MESTYKFDKGVSMTLYEDRLLHIQRFYKLLTELKTKVGGTRLLADCRGRMKWPRRGVYFFFEPGEYLTTSGKGYRVVLVGTHALRTGAKATLWDRLRTHRGTIGGEFPGGGDHRSSVFRKHVGTAFIEKGSWPESVTKSWGVGNAASKIFKKNEYPLEKAVSRHIRSMPFLWLKVDDEPGRNSDRGYIEKNAIAMLSNFKHQDNPIDLYSKTWLGRHAKNEKAQHSGLWNVKHIDVFYDPKFLEALARLIAEAGHLVIKPTGNPRKGWDEAFARMAAQGDDTLFDHDMTEHIWDEESWEW